MEECILVSYCNGRFSFYMAWGSFNNKGITQVITSFSQQVELCCLQPHDLNVNVAVINMSRQEGKLLQVI